MKIVGVGTDIVKIDRIARAIIKHENFKTRIYTLREITYCASKHKPELHYATRFAAKEAIAKAVGTGFRDFAFLNIEILKDQLGRPFTEPNGSLVKIMEERGIKDFQLSVSFDHEYAIAFAIAIG